VATVGTVNNPLLFIYFLGHSLVFEILNLFFLFVSQFDVQFVRFQVVFAADEFR